MSDEFGGLRQNSVDSNGRKWLHECWLQVYVRLIRYGGGLHSFLFDSMIFDSTSVLQTSWSSRTIQVPIDAPCRGLSVVVLVPRVL